MKILLHFVNSPFDKVVPNVLVDGRSGLNILLEHTMKKFGLNLTGPSPFVINMANQSPSTPLGMVEDCRIKTGENNTLSPFISLRCIRTRMHFPFCWVGLG